ncbi:MAG: CgeB family protein [Desulfonatronovibrionaceae bacterium]
MNIRYRILVVLPMYGGSLPVGRFCVQALKGLGHLTEVFEAPDFYSAFTALKGLRVGSSSLEQLENSFLQVVSNAVLAKVDFFEPDLVLCLAQAPLSRQALKRLGKDKVPTAMWFVEDFKVFGYWRAFAPYYDLFAVIQKEPFLTELSRVGQSNCLYLPLAADPDFHRPLELGPVERSRWGSDVSFMGAGYPNRRRAFRDLTGYDFKIWGTEWEGDSALSRLVQMEGRRITSEECVKIFNASKINLNLHSSIDQDQTVKAGDFVNPRTFELASCGAFQLTDNRQLLPELFDAREIALFSSMDQLKEKIDYYLARPRERAEMAARARQRVLAGHSYGHRMEELISFARNRKIISPGRAAEGLPEDLPDDLRRDIQELLARLGLPASVGFQDLVHYIRQEQGRLSPLETSILFLDEWKKQYTKSS